MQIKLKSELSSQRASKADVCSERELAAIPHEQTLQLLEAQSENCIKLTLALFVIWLATGKN